MGIAKSQFDRILSDIFKAGNTIHLFAEVPDATTEAGGDRVSGTSYLGYEIKSGDFNVDKGEVTSAKNMMMYLCEDTDGHGTAKGFGVFSGGTMLYFGNFYNPIPINYNSVPTIKKYNASLKEGIKITMTSTEKEIDA